MGYTVDFAKAVASGNDFIILDNRNGRLADKISDFAKFAKVCCRRKYSVGADGVLILENSKSSDFRMRIFNPDGSEVTMCGNGIRCSALFAYAKKWCGSPMKIETGSGVLEADVREGSVKIKMTPPKDIKLDCNIGVGKTVMAVHTVDTGVPHAVHFVDDIGNYPVKETGSRLRHHNMFQPAGINADFVEFRNKAEIAVRTYERGVEDETLACGTGVVASAVIAHIVKKAESPVRTLTRGGDILKVYFKMEYGRFTDVYLEGKAQIVYEGGVNYV